MPAGASTDEWGSGGAIFRTDLDLPGRREGKVRDVYDLPGEGRGGGERLLIVATDRLSAFDVVMPTPIPGKGELLTRLAAWWLRWIEDRGLSRTHLLSTDVGEIPELALKGLGREALRGRVMIAKRCRVVPIECVVRGYLEGSGLKEYEATGKVCGVELPGGLRRASRLPRAIFTPATKEERGRHDENITFERACEVAGREVMEGLRARSLAIYEAASEYALARGIIIADTKFEFGVPVDAQGRAEGEPILVDEALTPDSSRFWPVDGYEPGRAQASFDKQFVRDYLEGLVKKGIWDKSPPGPELPPDVVEGTRRRYAEACERLMG